MTTPPRVDRERLWRRIEDLSRITLADVPWTRRAFTPLFLEGRAWLIEQFRDAGLETHIDAGGNLIGRLPGKTPGAKPLVTGSHSDTVPAGGRFDGILGVLAGIEVAKRLTELGAPLDHPFEVIDFLSEEPSDYGLSCVGSRALVGALTEDMLALTRPDGGTLAEGLRFVGGDPDALATVIRPPGSIAAYVEVHIEQGPVLESRNLDIGVVTAIAGIHRERIVIHGRADHAGTTPMNIRADALVGAALFITETHAHATTLAAEGSPLVATIGKLSVSPNAPNAIPERVDLILEVRSGHAEDLQAFVDAILDRTEGAITELGLRLEHEQISHALPTPCAANIQKAISSSSDYLGYSNLSMPSGAGHDGVFVANAGPIGMIFTACQGGRSHTPVEFADAETCAKGADTLLATLLRIDKELP